MTGLGNPRTFLNGDFEWEKHRIKWLVFHCYVFIARGYCKRTTDRKPMSFSCSMSETKGLEPWREWVTHGKPRQFWTFWTSNQRLASKGAEVCAPGHLSCFLSMVCLNIEDPKISKGQNFGIFWGIPVIFGHICASVPWSSQRTWPWHQGTVAPYHESWSISHSYPISLW